MKKNPRILIFNLFQLCLIRDMRSECILKIYHLNYVKNVSPNMVFAMHQHQVHYFDIRILIIFDFLIFKWLNHQIFIYNYTIIEI